MKAPALTLLLLASGCTCRSPLTATGDGQFRVSPEALVMPKTSVGERTVGIVTVTHLGGPALSLPVTVEEPFAVDVKTLALPTGEDRLVEVELTAQREGVIAGTLTIGDQRIEVTAPVAAACGPVATCLESRFDVDAGQCVVGPQATGSACETNCLIGTCSAGTCVGQSKACADTVCTVGVCSEGAGCTQVAKTCPAASNPCQTATCDVERGGCALIDQPEGTLCGVDDCLVRNVDICIQGQCVARPRPATGRCNNTWLPAYVQPSGYSHVLAYDAARDRVVMFGGSHGSNDTWEWVGMRWVRRAPPQAPPWRSTRAFAYDSARKRVVLAGGVSGLTHFDDTWEWDGTTWFEAHPVLKPPARDQSVLAYDSARKRIVRFGLAENGTSSTWEWDGAQWVDRLAAIDALLIRGSTSLTYDSKRHRVVLFATATRLGVLTPETWEWDGKQWTQQMVNHSPTPRLEATMAYDSVNQAVWLYSGQPTGNLGGSDSALWSFDGADWVAPALTQSPSPRTGSQMAYDSAAEALIAFGGLTQEGARLGDTWAFDGQVWRELNHLERPEPSFDGKLVYDTRRKRVVFVGGRATWSWSGAQWSEDHPGQTLVSRSLFGLAYDESRRTVIRFGGTDNAGSAKNDTWEYDGTVWALRTPSTSPSPRSEHSMVFDFARHRVVVFGGADANGAVLDDLWEWDGADWFLFTPVGVERPPARRAASMAFEKTGGRLVVFGGLGADGGPMNDTWSFQAGTWHRVDSPTSPTPRSGAPMMYDGAAGHLLLAGGYPVRSGATDSWVLAGENWSQLPTASAPATMYGSMAYDDAHDRVVFLDSHGATWLFVR